MPNPKEFLAEAARKLAEPEHAGLRKDLSIFIDYWMLDSYEPPERVEMRVREIVKGFVVAAQMIAKEGLPMSMPDEFTPDDMLSNAAVAAQHLPLIEDKVIRGAVLRSVRQWLELHNYDIRDAIVALERHPDFDA